MVQVATPPAGHESLTDKRNKTVRFPTELEEWVQSLADANDRSFSYEVRRIVEAERDASSATAT